MATQQIMLLGLTFMAIAATAIRVYAILAGRARAFLTRRAIHALEIASGRCLLGGGVWLALRGR